MASVGPQGSQPLLLPVGKATGVDTVDAVDTVICAPDDGCRNYPKHVE